MREWITCDQEAIGQELPLYSVLSLSPLKFPQVFVMKYFSQINRFNVETP